MSDVLENDFFANVQITPLESPHLAATPKPAEAAPHETISVESFTTLGYSALNREVHGLINQNDKWLFGYSTAGADVPSTPESRMKGLRNVLSSYEQYKQYGNLTPLEVLKKSQYLESRRKFMGNDLPITDILASQREDDVTNIFWELVATKDPLIVALAQIGDRHSMGEKSFATFTRDAIVAFRHEEVVEAVKTRLTSIRKSIGKAAIVSK